VCIGILERRERLYVDEEAWSAPASRESMDTVRSCAGAVKPYEDLTRRQPYACAYSSVLSYLSPCLPTYSSVKGGDSSCASPLGCGGSGLSRDSGLDAGSASRGDALSAREKDAALGERAGRNGTAVGLRCTGMLEACDRNAEKLGTAICARDACFLTACCCGTCGGAV